MRRFEDGQFEKRLWLFRPPRSAALERLASDDALLVPDFGVFEDLSDHLDFNDILGEMHESHPGESPRRVENLARQMHLLLNDIQAGDLIISPMRLTGDISIGIARMEKDACPEGRPGRKVEWLAQGIDRSALLPDLLHSLAAKQTICAITRNEASRRVEAIVGIGSDPGPSGRALEIPDDPDELELILRKRIAIKVGAEFAGHDLAILASAVLEADGYRCELSPPGPDGGVDIFAGRGLTGLSDGLVVQVKSGDIVADHPTLQQLIGAMAQTGAGQGLLISWGGATRAVRAKIKDEWFRVRIWSADELVGAMLDVYEDLPVSIRDRIGLRKTWM